MIVKKKNSNTVKKDTKKVADTENNDTTVSDVMIAEAAYYKAESRGFITGHELEDWLEAETNLKKN